MAVEILLHAFTHDKALKGTPVVVKCCSQLSISPWGTREGLPNYVVLEVTDIEKEDCLFCMDAVKRLITCELVSSNILGRRYKLSVDPRIPAKLGVDAAFGDALLYYIQDEYSGANVSWNPEIGECVFDIPHQDNWTTFENKMESMFKENLMVNRYHFPEADVDTIIANGGKLTEDSSGIYSRLIDRLD